MKNAFSLVELSIVLVILGLLVGGVLTGQSLIRAAELRSVTTEFQQYQTAVQTFRDRFFAIPGDMRNATEFWGEAAAVATCGVTVGTGTETCDGNGDGRIINSGGINEPFRFWQHLANAGLIEGNFTGVQGPGGGVDAVPAVNVPRSRVSNAGWFIRTETGPFSANASFFDGFYGTRYVIGADGGTSNTTQGRLFTPEEAWNVDTKMDDGRPGQGQVVVLYHSLCSNAADSADRDADYLLSSTANDCVLNFLVDDRL